MKKHLLNCFLLTLPVMAWNIAFTRHLPPAFQANIFWQDIPAFLTYGENISRTAVFLLTLLMPLSIKTSRQKKGMILYITGTLIYFISWITLIYSPNSYWSLHVAGFMAPAYTPLLWLGGIALIGNSFYFHLPFKPWLFFLISVIFLIFHNLHTFTIYNRTH